MLLNLENISKSYGPAGTPVVRKILEKLSLQVNEAESIAILGPSGSGKTTLLNIIGSLDHPDEGQVLFRGENITGYPDDKLNLFRNSQVGYIFQMHHLLPQLTLLENVLLPTITLKNKGDRQERFEYACALMKRVGVWDQRDQKPGQMSGGECQRTAVIRAMINSPSLLLADEPTGALDTDNAEKLTGLLLDINKNDKVALIVVTHSRILAEKMESLYELKNGHLLKQNS